MEKRIGERLGIAEKLGFLCFSMSDNIIYYFKSIYYLIFLTNVLNIPMMMAGIMTAVGTIWDAVNDPLVGVITANRKFRTGETIRPYLKYMSLPWAISMVLLFTDFHLSLMPTVIVSLVVFFFYELENTFLGIPYNAMANVATGDDSERRSINAFRSLGGCLGSGIGAVAVAPLVRMLGGLQGQGAIIGPEDAGALFKSALLMGVICMAGCLIHYFTCRERVHAAAGDAEEKVTFRSAYRMLFHCQSWVANMFYIIAYSVVNLLLMNMINYYASYVLGESAAATPILAVYLLTSVIFSILTPAIDRKLGRKKTMIAGALVQIIAKIPFILNPYSIVNVYINAIGVGIGATITFIMFNTNRNNISDLIEAENGRRLDTMISTGDGLAAKLAQALAAQLMTFSLAKAGFEQTLKLNQNPAVIHTINALLGWVPAAVAVLMLVAIRYIRIDCEMKQAVSGQEGEKR